MVDACAEAATAAAEQLARLAVEETGYGNVPDKIIKNRVASVECHRAIRGMKTVGIVREDRERKILEVAEPVGVVAAIIPSTNPTSTAIYKTLISLKAGNAIVLSPHPSAMKCICETVAVLQKAAQRAGAPDGIIICLDSPTLQGTHELMRHRDTGVILSTGGTGLVRAAYSSGKPAYGVGPGNVPAYIERTADVPKAVADIFAGKTFDYGTICSAEQAIIAEEPVREHVLEECRRQGAYFLTPEEILRLGELVYPLGAATPNPKVVGRHAVTIAGIAGIPVPVGTRLLIAKLEGVGREHPLSLEKLSPILAFYSVPDRKAAIELATRLLHAGGLGHTIAIHSRDDAAIREFGQGVPAYRVCVNTSAVHGSIGYSTNLFPAMTLGCGAVGGNITSDNIGPQHLLNIKRIAWESRGVAHRTVAREKRMSAEAPPPAPAAIVPAAAKSPAVVASAPAIPAASGGSPGPDRQMIARIVERVFAERGIPRSGGRATATYDVTEKSAAGYERSGAVPRPAEPRGSVVEFVSESDVRSAVSRGEKIFIGPKTIVTPSARDLAATHDVFVETQGSGERRAAQTAHAE